MSKEWGFKTEFKQALYDCYICGSPLYYIEKQITTCLNRDCRTYEN